MKRLFILLSISFLAGIIIAQEVQTMYIIHNNTVTHQIPISEIDSIVFQTPALIVSVRDVELERNTLELSINQSETLTATMFPTNATNQRVSWSSNNPAVATVNANGVVTAVRAGTATITVTTEDGNRTAACVVTVLPVGIGAPTLTTDPGVMIGNIRWATRNVDLPGTFASTPESAGRFFQWGTRLGVTHHWASTGTVSGWQNTDFRVAWTPENDPCPQGWRVPTQQELQSLNNVAHIWTSLNDVNGRLFGIAPNQIFLPASGWRQERTGLLSDDVGMRGSYWSSDEAGGYRAVSSGFSSGSSGVYLHVRARALSIRCVAR